MTEMRRVTISLPAELEESLEAMKQRKEYARGSLSDMIRQLLLRGLALDAEEMAARQDTNNDGQRAG